MEAGSTVSIVNKDGLTAVMGDAGSTSSVTDLTSLSSEDSDLDVSSKKPLPAAQRQGRKKSVRFSIVHTREYNVVEEIPAGDDEEGDSPRRSLGWDYTEKESHVDTHLDEIKLAKRNEYLIMIQNHINRVECRQMEERGKTRRKQKKGLKSKILKPMWKGLIELGSRSASAIPSPYESS